MSTLIISDPNRPMFAKEKKFMLTSEQVKHIKTHNLIHALCSGLDLEVYRAFQRPENLALL